MDFKSLVWPSGGVASLPADALLLVITGAKPPQGVEPAVSALLKDALKQGDLELKPGRALYIHRPAGVKAENILGANIVL